MLLRVAAGPRADRGAARRVDRPRRPGDGEGAQARARALRPGATEDAQRQDHAPGHPGDVSRQGPRRPLVARQSGRREGDQRGGVACSEPSRH